MKAFLIIAAVLTASAIPVSAFAQHPYTPTFCENLAKLSPYIVEARNSGASLKKTQDNLYSLGRYSGMVEPGLQALEKLAEEIYTMRAYKNKTEANVSAAVLPRCLAKARQ